MDTGATSHMTNSSGNLSSISFKGHALSIIVGNGGRLATSGIGHANLQTPTHPLHLNNVLIAPKIVKNLISVRRFTTDNNVSLAFDPYGFSVNDLTTGVTRMRCNSTGELYPVTPPPASSQSCPVALSTSSSSLWHARLGHPSAVVLDVLRS